MNGIQEVSGSIPLISTNSIRVKQKDRFLMETVFLFHIERGTQMAERFQSLKQ